MKKKCLFLIPFLLVSLCISSLVNAGNVKKAYIHLAKEGQQATLTDLGTLATSYASIQNKQDTVAYDFTLNGNNGTYTNVKIEQGKFGKGARFQNAFASLPKSSSLDITGSKISIEMWVNPDDGNGVEQTFFHKDHQYTFAMNYNNKPGLTFAESSNWCYNCTGAYGGGKIPSNQWTHIAVTYDGAKYVFYINGEVVGTFNHTGNMVNQTDVATIGSYSMGNNTGNNYLFKGIMDEVAIWSKALTTEEIQSHMKNGIKGNPSELRGYWTFD